MPLPEVKSDKTTPTKEKPASQEKSPTKTYSRLRFRFTNNKEMEDTYKLLQDARRCIRFV